MGLAEHSNAALVRVVNSSGVQVFSSLIENEIFSIPVSSLGKTGMYLVQLLDKDNTIIHFKKVIVE